MTAPNNTMSAESTTPKRSRLPIISSIRLSVQARSLAISNPSREPFVEHLDSQNHDHDAEYPPQPLGLRFDENPRAQQRSGKNTQYDGHGKPRINISAGQINPRARRGCDANHEVAGRGRYFERDPHRLVHGENLHCPRTDTEQPR